jgi:hypothetical protein
MSNICHRMKRLTLILAGTAALSGAVAPLAMADVPVGSDNTPADAQQCQNYKNSYNDLYWAALQNLLAGRIQTATDQMGNAQHWKLIAEARGCDTSTWASTVNPGTPVAVNPVSVASVPVAQR